MSWITRLWAILPHLPPSLTQLIGLGAVALVAMALAGIGSMIGGRDRQPEADLLVGWGVVTAAFTLLGTLGAIDFTSIAGLLLVAGIGGYVLRLRQADAVFPEGLARALLLSLPLIAVTASMRPSQWDEFTQWLHSVRYLVDNDAFPGRGMPKSDAVYPAYPYALPLIGYLASRIAGSLVEGALATFNLLLLLPVALTVVRLVQAGLDARRQHPLNGPRSDPPGWGLTALGLLSVTAFSPTFVPKLVLTAYAETGTAVSVAIAAVLGWSALERAAVGDRQGAFGLAARMGLVLAALVALKEATLALYLLVLGAVVLAALRRPGVGWRLAVPALGLAAAPGLLVYVAWRLYIGVELSGQEIHVLPLALWHWHELPVILGSMGRVALGHFGHFGLMLVAAGCALRALWRTRGPFDSLAIISAGVMVGYNLFLLFSYLAIFQGWESERAASYWRYNTHVGLVGVVFAAYGGVLFWRHLELTQRLPEWTRRALAGTAIVLVLAGPVLLLDHLRFDIQPVKRFVQTVTQALTRRLPAGARLIVIDPEDTGFYPRFVNYLLDGKGRVVGSILAITPDHAEALRRLVEAQHPTHLLVLTPDPSVTALTGTAAPAGAASLFTAEDGQWRLTRRWPLPPDAIGVNHLK